MNNKILPLRPSLLKGKAVMKKYMSAAIVIAIILVVMFAWKPLIAGLQIPTPEAPAQPSPVTQGPTPQEPAAPTPELKRPPDKCLDGSPLNVTSRDSNQTNYNCGSGAIGAYLN
jgi:hypothetical protein